MDVFKDIDAILVSKRPKPVSPTEIGRMIGETTVRTRELLCMMERRGLVRYMSGLGWRDSYSPINFSSDLLLAVDSMVRLAIKNGNSPRVYPK